MQRLTVKKTNDGLLGGSPIGDVHVNMATGPLGERVAERRDQAHQPFEPDLGKPHRPRDTRLGRKTSVGKRPTDGDQGEPMSRAHGLFA